MQERVSQMECCLVGKWGEVSNLGMWLPLLRSELNEVW